MKRVCLLLICVVLVFCIGCTKQWSEEKGHIYRYDIESGDIAFLLNEWEYDSSMTSKEVGMELLNAIKSDMTPEDIFDALGLPMRTFQNYGLVNYGYALGDEHDLITIKYDPEKGVVDIHPEFYSIEDFADGKDILMHWSSGAEITDTEKYKMFKRFDINEKELSFINENTTSMDIQKKFGAPHHYIELRETYIESAPGNAFVYELENGSVFKVIYFRQGYILRAWVEDNGGKEEKVIIDRDIKDYYESN